MICPHCHTEVNGTIAFNPAPGVAVGYAGGVAAKNLIANTVCAGGGYNPTQLHDLTLCANGAAAQGCATPIFFITL